MKDENLLNKQEIEEIEKTTEDLSPKDAAMIFASKRIELMRALKFLFFSLSAGIIQIISFTLLNELVKWSYWPSYLISLTLSVLWNFTFNRKFTFKSAANIPIAMLEVFGYYLVFTPLSILGGDALTGANWNEYLVLAITMILNFVTEFLFCKYVVYRGKMDNQNVPKQTDFDEE